MGSNGSFEEAVTQATPGCSIHNCHVLRISEVQNVFCFTETYFRNVILFCSKIALWETTLPREGCG